MVELKQKHWLYIIIGILAILSAIMILPYVSALLLAAALAYVLYPLHFRLSKKIREQFSAFTITSGLFILMLLFVLYGINFLIRRLSSLTNLIPSSTTLFSRLENIGTTDMINNVVSRASEYLFSMTTKLPHYLISIFIFLIAFYYFLIKGPEIYLRIKALVPLSESKKEQLFSDIKRQVNAIVYVQLLIGVAQGIAGGIGLLVFGYEFVIVGTIIMAVLAFIPVLGPPLFYVPVAIYSILQEDYFSGVGLLLFGVLVISTIDNIVRPFIVGKKARVHPLVVLLGLFGGVLVFGFAGVLIGPIILSITITLIKDLEKFHVIE